MKSYLTFLLIIFFGINSFCQSKLSKQADSKFLTEEYEQALSLYQKALGELENEFYKGTIHFQIAESIRLQGDSISTYHYKQSIIHLKSEYANLSKNRQLDLDGKQKILIMKKNGLCHFRLDQFDMARMWFEKYTKSVPNDSEVETIMTRIRLSMEEEK